eukprot:5083111-Prymnesium_polylepis.1
MHDALGRRPGGFHGQPGRDRRQHQLAPRASGLRHEPQHGPRHVALDGVLENLEKPQHSFVQHVESFGADLLLLETGDAFCRPPHSSEHPHREVAQTAVLDKPKGLGEVLQ